jgi:DNA-binding transcriptional MerR regulator
MNVVELPVTFASFGAEPVYNVKAVCLRTGISAATLRAWERRYGIPQPDRSDQGYRLYSERDIAILFWLRHQTENGVNVAHAVAQLKTILENGQPVELHTPPALPSGASSGIRSPGVLRAEITQSLRALDERAFGRLMNEALALYTMETALINILQASVRDLRTLRAENGISTTALNLALGYASQRLTSISHTLPNVRGTYKAAVLVGFSSEHNEFDLMIINVLLRRQGIPVTLLGTDLEPRMLEEAIANLNAGMIVFYTDEPRNVVRLVGMGALRNAEREAVRVAVCGMALHNAPELMPHIQVAFIGADLRQAVSEIIHYLVEVLPTKG